MDPKAALDAATRALKRRDYETAGEHLEAYWEWRRGGGFEPKGGDRKAERLGAKLSDEWPGGESGWGEAGGVEGEGYDENPWGRRGRGGPSSLNYKGFQIVAHDRKKGGAYGGFILLDIPVSPLQLGFFYDSKAQVLEAGRREVDRILDVRAEYDEKQKRGKKKSAKKPAAKKKAAPAKKAAKRPARKPAKKKAPKKKAAKKKAAKRQTQAEKVAALRRLLRGT